MNEPWAGPAQRLTPYQAVIQFFRERIPSPASPRTTNPSSDLVLLRRSGLVLLRPPHFLLGYSSRLLRAGSRSWQGHRSGPGMRRDHATYVPLFGPSGNTFSFIPPGTKFAGHVANRRITLPVTECPPSQRNISYDRCKAVARTGKASTTKKEHLRLASRARSRENGRHNCPPAG
jgi:hypothetical protein